MAVRNENVSALRLWGSEKPDFEHSLHDGSEKTFAHVDAFE